MTGESHAVLTEWDRGDIADACDAMMQFGDTWLRFIRNGDETVLLPVIERLVREARAEVVAGVRAWCSINEIAEPPLDWEGLGEFLSRVIPPGRTLDRDEGT